MIITTKESRLIWISLAVSSLVAVPFVTLAYRTSQGFGTLTSEVQSLKPSQDTTAWVYLFNEAALQNFGAIFWTVLFEVAAIPFLKTIHSSKPNIRVCTICSAWMLACAICIFRIVSGFERIRPLVTSWVKDNQSNFNLREFMAVRYLGHLLITGFMFFWMIITGLTLSMYERLSGGVQEPLMAGGEMA